MEDAAVLSVVRSPQELLKDFRETGRQTVFEEIVRRYAGMVFHTCLQVTKSNHDAEDVTQAVFLTLAVQCKTEKPIHALGPWLQQVAHRLSLDLRKSKKRRNAREEKHSVAYGGGVEPEASHQLDADELKHLLNEELNNLPPKYRMPLILHYFGGLSRDQMARELNCKPSTLGVRLFRGREMLGNRLSERGIGLSSSVLTAALAYCVQSSVSDGLVLSTSHAATALAAGHQPMAGLISAQVLAMSNGAMGAMAMARFKTLSVIVLIAGSTLTAGAQVVTKVIPAEWQLHNLLPQLRLQFSPPPIRSPLPSFHASATPSETKPLPAVPHYGQFTLPTPNDPAPVAEIRLFANQTTGRPMVSRAVEASLPALMPVDQLTAGAARRVEIIAQSGPVLTGNVEAAETSRPAFKAGEFVLSSPAATKREEPSTLSSVSSPSPRPSGEVASEVNVAAGTSGTLIIQTPASVSLAAGPVVGFIRIAGPDNGLLAEDAAWHHSLSPLPARQARTSASPLTAGTGLFVAAATLNEDRSTLLQQAHAIYAGTVSASSTTEALALSLDRDPHLAFMPNWSTDGQRLEGWGTVLLGGPLDASGQVIADGHGAERTLDLTRLEGILNGQDNPADGGINGWYAMRRGKLTLPQLIVQPSTASLTWGEDAADPTLDLVNSVRLTFGQPLLSAGTVQLSLLSPDRDDFPSLTSGDSVLGLWSIDAQGIALNDLGLTVRYDELQAQVAGSGEGMLRLWGYDGDWRQLDDGFWLDRDANLISARASGISLFAVTAGRPILISAPGGGPSSPPSATGAVPEPSAMLLALGFSTLLLRRRRTR